MIAVVIILPAILPSTVVVSVPILFTVTVVSRNSFLFLVVVAMTTVTIAAPSELVVNPLSSESSS